MEVLVVLILVAVAAEQVKPVLPEVLPLVATEVTDPLMFIKQDPVKHMLAVAVVVVIPDLVDLVELVQVIITLLLEEIVISEQVVILERLLEEQVAVPKVYIMQQRDFVREE